MKVNMKKPPGRFKRKLIRLLGFDSYRQNIKVHIDDWDTWSVDYTLAHIIYPLLIRFKKLNNGYLMLDNGIDREDVPDGKGDTCVEEECWDFVLDEMIWTFEQIQDETSDDQFYSGEIDFQFKELKEKDSDGDPLYALEHGPNDTFKVDDEGLRQHHERIDNGLRLFGKYFRSLWW